jgi:DNA-directed RNA polymerase specialized sigma24 family protein
LKRDDVERTDRAERLLALILLHSMRGASGAEKAIQLSTAGLTPVEIADILNTTTGVIHQYIYPERRKKTKKIK